MSDYKTLEEKSKYYKCKTINDFDGLVEFVKALNNCNVVFRGVREAKFKNYTSAQVKLMQAGYDLNKVSQEDFDNEMCNMIAAVRNDNDIMNICRQFSDDTTDMQILGLLQHYGYGTTLLDFSYKLEDAVFFALDNAIDKGIGGVDDYLSIYMFNLDDPNHCVYQDINVFYTQQVKDLHHKAIREYGTLYDGVSNQTKNSYKKIPYRELCGISRGGLTIGGGTATNIAYSDNETGISFDYNISSDRINVQKGLFKLSSQIELPYEEAAFNWYSGMKDRIFCLNIEKALIPKMREYYLEPNGISTETVYPVSETSRILKDLLSRLPINPVFKPTE